MQTQPANANKQVAFVPITKVDEARREVWGVLADETPDHAGEILDFVSSAPHFKAWSEGFSKSTGGKSVGNLRAMHQPVAAGKFISVDVNDAEKRVNVGAKVVDDAEWKKVLEGVYTGFSIGGQYGKTWADGNLKRYEGIPHEGSLVDAPCIPTATFTVVKADGETELRKFKPADEKDDPKDPDAPAEKMKLGEFVKALLQRDAAGAVIAGEEAQAAIKRMISEYALADDPSTWTLEDMVGALDRVNWAVGDAALTAQLESTDDGSALALDGVKSELSKMQQTIDALTSVVSDIATIAKSLPTGNEEAGSDEIEALGKKLDDLQKSVNSIASSPKAPGRPVGKQIGSIGEVNQGNAAETVERVLAQAKDLGLDPAGLAKLRLAAAEALVRVG